MAKAERKNTICPTGYLSPRKRTSVAITANSSADITLSEIAWTTFMVSDCSPAGRPGWWGWPIDHAARAGESRPLKHGVDADAVGPGLTQRGEKRGIVRPPAGRAIEIAPASKTRRQFGRTSHADLYRAGQLHRARPAQHQG